MLSPFVICCLEFQIFFAFMQKLLFKKKQQDETRNQPQTLLENK